MGKVNKAKFTKELERNLKILDSEERHRFITYYEEIIEDYIESGLSEEEAIIKIGTPGSIAGEILGGQDAVVVTKPSSGRKALNIVLLILGFPLWGSLLLALILCILSAYIVIWCVPFTTGAVAISFFAASLISAVGSPFVFADVPATGIFQLGFGIASMGVSILTALLTIFLAEKFVKITKIFTLKLRSVFGRKAVIL